MKQLLTFVAVVGVTTSGFAQGLISWANTSSTLITDLAVGGPVLVRTSPQTTYYFGLFVAPYGTPAPGFFDFYNPSWQYVAGYTTNSTAAAGAGRMQNPGVTTLTGYAPGTTVNFIVRGWQSSSPNGADWADLKTTYNFYNPGQSQMGYALLGGGAFPTPSAFGISAGQIPGFVLFAPEPSSLALLGAGAAVSLIFRRRRLQTSAHEKATCSPGSPSLRQ